MKSILPEEIRWRTSKSNVYPGWRFALRSHGRKEIEHLTGSPTPAAMEFLDFPRVRGLAARFLDGKATLREEASFWRALTLERWLSVKKD
jgi:hypothetical protein